MSNNGNSDDNGNNHSELIRRIITVRGTYEATRRGIIDRFPGFDENRDVRINIFSKCINALDGLFLGMIFYDNHLTEPNWWIETAAHLNLVEPPDEDKERWIDNFETFLKIAFIQVVVSSAIESSLRMIAEFIKSKECHGSFERVYQGLLEEVSLSQHESLLDLLRCIRNANHDNGIYFGREENITYKGTKYSFNNNQIVTFVTWDLLLDCVSDLRGLLSDLVNSSEVNSPDKIEDLSVI